MLEGYYDKSVGGKGRQEERVGIFEAAETVGEDEDWPPAGAVGGDAWRKEGRGGARADGCVEEGVEDGQTANVDGLASCGGLSGEKGTEMRREPDWKDIPQ